MSSQQQQAVIVPSPKAPFVVGPRDIPAPKKGEVLVKVMSVGLNPANWVQRVLDIMIAEYPAVLGCDIAGVVEALGEGVEGYQKGDRVFAAASDGGFQQYTTLLTGLLIRIPEKSTFDEVATIPLTFTTACVPLFGPSPIGLGLNPTFSWDKPQQGESALVIGAGASVGQFAIQLFKFIGFTRIVAYASKAHFDYLTQLGATECIDRASVPLDSLAATLGQPVKVVFDVTPTGALAAAYDCAVEGGSVVPVNPMVKWERENMKKLRLVYAAGTYVGPDVVKPKYDLPGDHALKPEHTTFGKLIIKNLPEMITKGVISATRFEVIPNGLAGIPGGMDRMQNGGVSGIKLVAHPQDPIV